MISPLNRSQALDRIHKERDELMEKIKILRNELEDCLADLDKNFEEQLLAITGETYER